MSVRVKPLVWNEYDRADVYAVSRSFGQGSKPYMLARGTTIVGWFDSAEAAKRAGERDHEARVLAAIDTDEPVAFLAE